MTPRFIFPPHPGDKMRMKASSLPRLEKEGDWLAQRKYNGSHMIAHVCEGMVTLWNRHSQPFTTYKLTPDMVRCFLSMDIDPKQEYVFDGEVLHTKAVLQATGQQAAKNTIVLFDLLWAGRYLLNWSFDERYNLLAKLCHSPTDLEPKKRGLVVATSGESQLWLAEVFKDEFAYRYYEMYEFDNNGNDKYPEIEGLVLKMTGPASRLIKVGNKMYDVDWMMRCRKTKEKMYLF